MHRRTTTRMAAIAVAGLLSTTLAACQDGSVTSGPSESSESSESTGTTDGAGSTDEGTDSTSAPPSTEEGASTEDSDGQDAATLPTEPGEYADALIRAYGADDRETASVYAIPEAVEQLFDSGEVPPGDTTWRRIGEEEWDRGTLRIQYVNDGGVRADVVLLPDEVGAGLPQAVRMVDQWVEDDDEDTGNPGDDITGLPTDPETYADEFVQHWADGNGDAAAAYATEEVLDTVMPVYNTGDWQMTGTEGDTVLFREEVDHQSLQLVVDPERVEQGLGLAIVEATLD